MTAQPSSKWIDCSVPLRPGVVHWPDNPAFQVEHPHDLARGDSSTISHLSMGSHTGTHVDAPVHFIPGGAGVDAIPPEAMVGSARVVQIEDPESIKPAELAAHRLRRGERVLFKTRNSLRQLYTSAFVEDFVHIPPETAAYLVALGVRTVGVDYLSIGGYHKGGAEAHRLLLQAGICIIEGLDLSAVRPGRYDLVCLPLRIAGGDGAPARALLRPR